MTRKPTIRDVARLAGVGIGTVSRVLNHSSQVSSSTRERILAAMDELGYRPNVVARHLPRRTTFQNIGVLTPILFSYYSFSERLRGVQSVLQSHRSAYELMLFSIISPARFHERLMEIIHTRTIDGLLIIDLVPGARDIDALRVAGLPFVGLNHVMHGDWPCIGTDNVRGGQMATRTLIDYGHRRIAYLGDNVDDLAGFVTGEERLKGYRRALEAAGIAYNPRLVFRGPHDVQTARQLTHRLLQLRPLPTAIFAMSDTQAMAAIAVLNEAGLRVPDDLSVIGYDDLEISQQIGLTTVRHHLDLSGKLGTEYLLACIEENADAPVPMLPPLQVIVRRTVGVPREVNINA